MSLRRGFSWMGAVVVGSVACGGTNFEVAGADAAGDVTAPGADAAPAIDVSQPQQEGGGYDAKDDTGIVADAGHPEDADAALDAVGGGRDASSDAGSPDDATVQDASRAMDSAVDAPLIVDTGVDAPVTCANKVANTGAGVFLVNGTNASPTPCGGPGTECTDLPSAIASLATGQQHIIYVGNGTYNVPAGLVLPEGVILQGGWNATPGNNQYNFAPTCSITATFVANGASVFNVGSQSTSTITLDTIAVENEATAPAGESLYGIFAVGSGTLVLKDVDITVPAAGSGQSGTSGVAGANSPTTCSAGNASNGPTGNAGPAGSYGPGGFTTGGPGQAGGNGAQGATGADTPPGNCSTQNTGCLAEVRTGVCGGVLTSNVCSPDVPGGCGGGGGTGGTPGFGGGSSIALYLWNEAAVLTGGQLTAGNGGAGGSGGSGGAGGTGQAAPVENETSVTVYTGCSPTTGGVCHGTGGTTWTVAAPKGNPGLTGGAGGTGGGGAGGDSYAIYKGGSASASVTSTTLSIGSAGPGGSPNGPNGHSGQTN